MRARQDIKHMSDSSSAITPSYNIIRQQITSDSIYLRQREQINQLLSLFKEEENKLLTSYVTLGEKILSWDLIKAAALDFQTLCDHKCSCCCRFMIFTCGTKFNISPNFVFFPIGGYRAMRKTTNRTSFVRQQLIILFVMQDMHI